MKTDTRDLPQEKQHVHGHQTVPSDLTLRVKALGSLLVEKGLVDPAALDALIDTYEHKIGPRNGTRVVARAWVDPSYKERLLTDATAAIGELGYTGGQGEHMIVVANGPKVDNLVVCTLCSCYPWPVLGTILLDHGVHVFPDTNADFLGENPQLLYSVRFTARELWGEQVSSRDAVYLDMWDDYLEYA